LKGSEKFGTRAELKNINSFRFVRKAIDFELNRQAEVIENGGRVIQETRLWNSDEERTVSMRSKEEAHDYRYFPDPDLPLLVLDEDWLSGIRESMIELPESRRSRFVAAYAMSDYDAGVLTMTRALAEFFDETARLSGQPKGAANWIMGDLLRFFKDGNVDLKDLSQSPVTPKMLADMILLVEKGTISGKIAKTVMEEMYTTGKAPDAIVQEKGLVQISNSGELEAIVDNVMTQHADAVAQFRSGKLGSLGFLVGQVMKATQGRANPQAVNELLRKRLAG
jgi:aspartyl-tRNA(Asn)/glutamyl-tRNA(Gln) amidotransferase subunit B